MSRNGTTKKIWHFPPYSILKSVVLKVIASKAILGEIKVMFITFVLHVKKFDVTYVEEICDVGLKEALSFIVEPVAQGLRVGDTKSIYITGNG